MKKFLTILLLLTLINVASSQFFEINFPDTTALEEVPINTFIAGHLKNISNDSLHIKMVRLQNNLPSASWTSSMCINVCFPPNVDSASTMDPGFNAIPPGDSVVVDIVLVQYDSIPGQASVLIKYATMDDAQIHYQWFEASSVLSGIEETDKKPVTQFKLLNNYPNPFNNQTIISAQIEKASNVTLQIFDILGREIFSTNQEISSAGKVTFRWNGLNNSGEELSSGIYFYRVSALSAGSVNQTQIKKLTLLR